MSYVLNKIPETFLKTITEEIIRFNKALDFDAINIKNENRLGIETMNEENDGLVRLISKIATKHEGYLKFDHAEELNDLLRYYDALTKMRKALIELFENIDGTHWGVSVDCMKMSQRYYHTLQTQRHIQAIDISMNQVDEWNKTYANIHMQRNESASK